MKKLIANGIEWLYRPGIVYTTMYRGYNINIRKVPASKERPWRLYVNKNGGGSLAYKWQFHASIAAARNVGIELVNLKKDHNATPYA